jgi:hypothetical protein
VDDGGEVRRVVGRDVLGDPAGPLGLVVSIRVRAADVPEHRGGVPFDAEGAKKQGRLPFWGALDGSLAAIGGRIGRYSGAVETNAMGDERTVPVTLSTYVGKERLSGSPADIPVKDLYAYFTFMGQNRAAIPATSAPSTVLGWRSPSAWSSILTPARRTSQARRGA